MKKFPEIARLAKTVALAAALAGCSTAEKVVVDYVMPAKEVADVKSVNVAKIRVNANVKGNLAGDNARNAALVRQLLAMGLYKEGYYQVTDDIWCDPATSADFSGILAAKDAGHGYPGLAAVGQGGEKVVIDLDLDLTLDVNPVQQDRKFSLVTMPFKMNKAKPGEMPTSSPDAEAAATEVVTVPVTVYETVANGSLRARFTAPEGRECPVEYAKDFTLAIPEKDRLREAPPSQLEALAAAVTPAVTGVVRDISPYRKSRELKAVEGGDERVATLLTGKAFSEVVLFVEDLEAGNAAKSADYENMGIALEATGDFSGARDAYKKAVAANPQSATAKEGLARVDDALAGKKAVRESAEKNKDIQFSK